MSSADAAARQLQAARVIYPLYRALIERFDLEMFTCRDLDQPSEDAEAPTRIILWFNEADKHIDVTHIRRLLQSHSVPEAMLRALILRHLEKPEKTEADRYKVDFLLGHYLAQNLPPEALNEIQVKSSRVAEALAPVLGNNAYIGCLEDLDECTRELRECEHIQDLLDRKILNRGKHLKRQVGEHYIRPAAMVAFTRFNFLIRRCLIKLLATDLDEIGSLTSELQVRGAQSIDCSSAGLAADESVASLRERIKHWRKPFQGKYSEMEWLEQISKLRTLLKAAVEQSDPKPPVTTMADTPPPATPAAKHAQVPSTDTPKPVPAIAPKPAPVTRTAGPSAAAVKFAASAAKPLNKPPVVAVQWAQARKLVKQWYASLRSIALAVWAQITERLSQAKSTIPATQENVPLPQEPMDAGAAARPAVASATIAQPSVVVREAIKRITEQIGSLPANSDGNLVVSGTQLTLSARELGAFRRPQESLSGILQRSAAVRLVLTEALSQSAQADPKSLNATLKFAYAEATMLQQRVEHARNNKDVDGVVLLTACLRALQTLIEQAEGRAVRTASP